MSTIKTSSTRDRTLVVVFGVTILALSYFGFHFNQDCLSVSLDGAAYRTFLANQNLNHSPFSQEGVDATQANFDAYYPLFNEYLLPHALAGLLFNLFPDRVTVYFLYGASVLMAIYALARSINLPLLTGMAGGFLFDLLGLPGLLGHYSEFGANFHLNPYWVQDALACFLIMTSFWALGGRKLNEPSTWLLMIVPTACLSLAVVSTGAQTIFIVPAAAVYGGASFFDGLNWKNNAARVLAALLMALVAVGSGEVTYFFSLVQYSAYNFFSSEFINYRLPLTSISTFFMTQVGAITVLFGLAGAIWAIAASGGRIRIFAVAHLVVTLGLFIGGFITVFALKSYHGSPTFYFEMFVWPVALMFTAYLVIKLTGLLSARVAAIRNHTEADVAALALLIMMTSVFFYGCVQLIQGFTSECTAARFNPIRSTAITDYLSGAVALRSGELFRGIAATIDGADASQSVSWLDLFAYDAHLWDDLGNDHRSAGLWRYHIPTLFQYFTFITPPYYLLLTDFLAKPQDKQQRSVLVLTNIDPKMMELWGVRFVITDQLSNAGKQVVQIDRPNGPSLRLIEFQDFNRGNYSPIEFENVDSARAALMKMHKASFNPKQTVLTDRHLDGVFSAASEVRLVYETYGFRVYARSSGSSILVLPVQYSHCWTIEGSGMPALFRADLMQLGIRFTGALDARLIFRYGPIFASNCRLGDLKDMYRLHFSEARQISSTN